MKKHLFFILLALLSWSGGITAQERTVEIVKGGQVVFSSPTKDIEYLTVVNRLPAPKNVRGSIADGKITVTWDAVGGATSYNVFRSADGNSWSKLGTATTTSYTDNSPKSGLNYYRVQALGSNDSQSAMSESSPAIANDAQDKASGIYIGMIGFNQKLTNHPINLLTEESKQGYYDFIDAFSNNNDGTAIYYAVDQAITTLQSNAYPADLNSVHIVTFTDGIDNYSLDIYDEIEFGKYNSPDEVGDFVKSRLKDEKVAGQDIQGYAVGSRHSDVNSTRFTSTLKRIASSDALVYELTDMSAVENKFKEIARNITEVNKSQNITVAIAGGLANGERIRFTFDLSSTAPSPANSGLYIEGTFQRTSATTRKITNLTCKGLEDLKEKEVVGTKNAETGLFEFTFTDVATKSKALINTSKTLEWWGNPWQKDTEFNPDANTKTEVITHSAAIILVLDCTKSLGSKFAQMQTSAKSFIATLLDQSYQGGETGGESGGQTEGIVSFEANGVSFNMVAVEGGTFQMGATDEQTDSGFTIPSNEKNVHSVTLSDYYIGETEVTQALWYAVMGAKPSSGYSWTSQYGLGDNYPAYNISYTECQQFITKLNQMTGQTFRMPTEAEWEYAARGGKKRQGYIFSGSDMIDDVAWYSGISGSMTHPVAQKRSNELGLYDMSGNVWEWCSDWFSSTYSSSAQTNPTGPASGTDRVYRGGGCGSTATTCRVSIRGGVAPSTHGNGLGLRLAMTYVGEGAGEGNGQQGNGGETGGTGNPSYNGHEYVDLGLPSGLKWATCNVGASSPTGYGSYFAWGETTTKSTYSSSTSSWYGKTNSQLQSAGVIDNNGNLTAKYDAATANWGGSWRMPTKGEMDELVSNCTTTWTTQNGVYGRKLTSKKNGNSIFLPAAGYRNGSSLDSAGSSGNYWSATPNGSDSSDSYGLYFHSGRFYVSDSDRYYGLSVRAVSE